MTESCLPETSGKKIKEYVYSVISMILTGIVVISAVFVFLFRIVGVSGDSMNPGLLNGSQVLVSSFFYTPERGDIIAFGKTNDENKNSSVIKRVVGLPGDEIDINFENHLIFVNGQIILEKYDVTEAISVKGDVTFPLTVPENCVFVLGDNRNNSLDSRFSEIGFVSYNEILGKAVFGLFPFGNIK